MNLQFGAATVQITNAREALLASEHKSVTAASINRMKSAIAERQEQFEALPDEVSFDVVLDPKRAEGDKIQVRVGEIEETLTRGTWQGDFFTHLNGNDNFWKRAIALAETFIEALKP